MKSTLRDPNSKGFWFGIGALTVLCVPYPFVGTAEPLVGRFPLWFLISLLAAIGIVVLTVGAIRRRWQLGSLAGDPDESSDG